MPSFRRLMQKPVVLLLAGLLLIAFVSPFSYLPNPAGIFYLLRGGYAYDARLPFLVNRFALLRGDPEVALRAKLDGLLGTTGLDPLDPVQPLQAYEIQHVIYGRGDWAHGMVRMSYADGSSRSYTIPVVQSSQGWGRPGGWAYTDLDRYYTPHLPLPPYLEFAGTDAPIGLGIPQRLSVPDETHRLGAGLLYGWYTSSWREGEGAVWSPNGDAFLLGARRQEPDQLLELWMVPLDGQDAMHLASGVHKYVWSGDGRKIAFLRRTRAASPDGSPWEVVMIGRDARHEQVLGRTDVDARPIFAGGTLWYLAQGALWRAEPDDQPPQQMAKLQELAIPGRSVGFALAPDAQRMAYRCGDAICLADTSGHTTARVDLGAPPAAPTPTSYPKESQPGPAPTAPPASRPPAGPVPQRANFAFLELAWSPAGDRLAAVASDYGEADIPVLWILDSSGRILHKVMLGPNGFSRIPQWTPDGRWIFLNTFPEAGRRIVAVEAASGRLFDLSQPRWDTFCSLSPNGQELLLWNGRGGFWTVPIEVRG